MLPQSTLSFCCGKMAAGKSTLAKKIAEEQNTILLVEDYLLAQLYPGEIIDIQSYIKYSRRLKVAIAPHIIDLLAKGLSVVLDFPANTVEQRKWFRQLFESARTSHQLYFIDATDDLCKQQLKIRSKDPSKASAFDNDAVFEEITKYFQPPSADEGFNIIRDERC
jgi:predicted kinase